MIGSTVSHYQIESRLGGGGMGVVYRAQDLRLGRNVAIKFLPATLVSDRLALERFQREARTASALSHPNICTIHEIDEWENQPFIVMELLEGQSLKQLITGRALPMGQLLDIAIQIGDHPSRSEAGQYFPDAARTGEDSRLWVSQAGVHAAHRR